MEFASAKDILGATDVPFEHVYLPALKKHVVVVGMSGKARDSFEASLVVGKGKARKVNTENIRAKLAARCLYDKPPAEAGQRLFSDDQADAIGNVRADVLAPIFDVAQKLSGISDEDIEELGNASAKTDSTTSSSN